MNHDAIHLLGLKDLPLGAGSAILHQAEQYKKQRANPPKLPLAGQTWAMIFTKPSTRTRVSFEVGIREMGGTPVFLNVNDIQLGRGEPVRDTAAVIGRMCHGAVIRTFAQQDIVDFANYSGIPTVNALTDDEHPCQILADIFTYEEKRGSIVGKKIAYIGDANNNMGRSWAYAAEYFKFNLWLAAPKGYECPVQGEHVRQVTDPAEAAANADMVYTDVWVSMGMEKEAAERERIFLPYQLNHELLKRSHPDVLVQHCLPAYRGKEITAELMDEHAQGIFDQAENRLHVQKGVLHWLVHREAH